MKYYFLFIYFLLIILFSGCLNYTQKVHLYPDGTGSMEVHYWMQLPDVESSKVVEKIGLFAPDSIRKEFSSQFSQINDISVYTDSTDSTTHSIIKLNFEHIDSLNGTKAFSDFHFKLEDGAAGQKIFSQFIPAIATGFGIDGSKYTVRYEYIFHGNIITHNAVSQQGRTLIWNYSLADIGSGKTISVTFQPYKLKHTPYWIYYLSGLVLLIVIFFLFKKRRS